MMDFQPIREELEQQRARVAARLHEIQSERRQEDGPLDADWSEQAIDLESEEVLTQLDARSRMDLERLTAAIARIDAGKYGQCSVCGRKINPKRLKALPHADACMGCASR